MRIAPVIPKHASLWTLLSFFFLGGGGTGHLTTRPPYQGCKTDGWPNDTDVDPLDHPESQAPRHTIGPPTVPQQIVSLPHLNIHVLPPGLPRIQDNSKTLDRRGAT